MLSRTVQEKINQREESLATLKMKIEELENEKKRVNGDIEAANKAGDVEAVLQLKRDLVKVEADLQELTAVFREMAAYLPIDPEFFREELTQFNRPFREALDEKYTVIIKTLEQLRGLYDDYENTYEVYQRQARPWERLAKKIKGSRMVLVEDKLAWIHARARVEIKNILKREGVK